MTPYYHAVSSANMYGGRWQDYYPVHSWFDDDSKACYHDFRHRAARHHSLGIKECVERFGPVIVNSDGKEIPTKEIASQHVMEDCGRVPSLSDWLSCITPEKWMLKVAKKNPEVIAEMERIALENSNVTLLESQSDNPMEYAHVAS